MYVNYDDVADSYWADPFTCSNGFYNIPFSHTNDSAAVHSCRDNIVISLCHEWETPTLVGSCFKTINVAVNR